MDDNRDNAEEMARTGILRTDGGTSIIVYPLLKVSLGQAIVVVTGSTVFCLEAAWDGMSENDRERFRQAAARSTGWIDRQADFPNLVGNLKRGGRWCAHRGYSKEAKGAVRDSDAVAFGAVLPTLQSAGTIVVGGSLSDAARYCVTCEGAMEASRACSPRESGFGRDSQAAEEVDRQLKYDMEEKAERDTDRQLREESIEPDQGWEPWMMIGLRTMLRVEEITEAQAETWKEDQAEGAAAATSAKKNLRPDAGVHLVHHVRQVNPTVSCRVPHASHVPYIVQCVSNHAMRQVHQVPEKYSEPIYSLQSAIGMTAFG